MTKEQKMWAVRAWDGVFDGDVDFSFTVLLGMEVSTWSMIEHPGLEHWTAELRVEDCSRSSRWAIAADLDLVRADLRESPNFVFSVEETAFGLEQVAYDIEQSSSQPDQVLMVRMAVVDEFWRGRSLGPALVWQAARRLNCSFVALEPNAFDTRVVAGRCVPADEGATASEEARDKVRQVWRGAGFEPLTPTTWVAQIGDPMQPYLASVLLLDEASGLLATLDADHWLSERDGSRRAERSTVRIPGVPRPR